MSSSLSRDIFFSFTILHPKCKSREFRYTEFECFQMKSHYKGCHLAESNSRTKTLGLPKLTASAVGLLVGCRWGCRWVAIMTSAISFAPCVNTYFFRVILACRGLQTPINVGKYWRNLHILEI